jgi:hypothetical protein
MWSRPRRTIAHLSPLGVLALAVGLNVLGCSGSKDDSNPAAGGGNGGTDQIPDPTESSTKPIDPGTKSVHRLNTNEYNSTVQDVLGTQLAPATDQWRGGELGGFDNMAAVLGVDGNQYERYFNAAEQLAADVFAKDAQRAKFMPCAAQDDPACIKTIIQTAGLKVFRRPVSDEEVTTYGKVYAGARAQGDDHTASAKLVLQALLSSAEFLYRIELEPTPGSAAKHPLNAYELASRLSYFLWSSAPDDQLYAAAANDSLTDIGVLSQAVDYMLTDARSNRFVSNFAGQWLGARKVAIHPTAAEIYPAWNQEVANAAGEEMYLFFNEFLRSERSWLDFMKADINFVNAPLAAFYGNGMAAPAQGLRVENVPDGRAGFAGLVGFLAMTSPDRRSSPTLRGAWLLRNMMCTIPPDPPPNIPELEKSGNTDSTNVRDILEQHRSAVQCASCHSLFDPFGLALEQYDGIGKFRSTYADGSTIDPKTTLANGTELVGIEGAANAISQDPGFATCISQKLLTYGLGRLLVDADKPYLDVVNKEWLKEGTTPTVKRLVQGLITSESFRYRRGEGK